MFPNPSAFLPFLTFRPLNLMCGEMHVSHTIACLLLPLRLSLITGATSPPISLPPVPLYCLLQLLVVIYPGESFCLGQIFIFTGR